MMCFSFNLLTISSTASSALPSNSSPGAFMALGKDWNTLVGDPFSPSFSSSTSMREASKFGFEPETDWVKVIEVLGRF